MLLKCPGCGVKNYLDPYPFWNFKGKTRCAGCEGIWYLERENGQLVRGPEKASGAPDLLPGFADTQDHQPVVGPGKTRPAPRARPDSQCRPIPIQKNIRGRLVSGRPLKPEELVGSRARFIVEGRSS
ncbi:MAG: hypothetical protein HYY85_22430 [Deltaproteobacteria bacterium]|nr:hypothetical protein [Deltaproteobacteria bacterium]